MCLLSSSGKAWKRLRRKGSLMSNNSSFTPLAVDSQSFTEDRLHKNSGWKLYYQTVIARAYPRIIGQQREKSWLFFDIFLPLLSVCAYVFVYRALKAPEDYIGFVVIGGGVTAFLVDWV